MALFAVSIHAPAWGATTGEPSRRAEATFQFTLPHGERRAPGLLAAPPAGVSIHAPAWGATGNTLLVSQTRTFQFTLPHGERRPEGYRKGAGHPVSIHAPAWGATVGALGGQAEVVVSIHAPAWGATKAAPSRSRPTAFQFTLPHGERLDDGSRRGQLLPFQFTLPHGERRVAQSCPAAVCSFNSRSRMGSDLRAGPAPAVLGVSIHAPAWGATQCPSSCAITFAFQFTLPHGERHGCASTSASSGCFNSRSRMGSDSAPRQQVAFSCSFQFTLPHGERQERLEKEAEELKFQFTLPHGERRGRRAARTGGRRFNSRSRMGSDSAGCGRL